MASRHWVGGTAAWDATAGSKWATTSGGAGGAAVPTAADDVFFDAASGAAVVTISVATCRSLNCTGFTGELVHTAGVTINIGDATAGAGNVALLLVAGMTYTLGNASTSALNFVSTSATQQTITWGAKAVGNVTFNGVGGSWLFADVMSSPAGTLTLNNGTLNTNSQAVTAFALAHSAGTATLTMGSSAWAISGSPGSAVNISASGLTVTANTAVITTGNNTSLALGTAINWNGASFVIPISNAQRILTGAGCTVGNLTLTGSASKTNAFGLNSSFTVTGTLTITGDSAVNRLLISTATVGTASTVTAAAVSLTNVDFMDITGAGAASPFTGTSLGNCLGNSGISFTTPVTQTATVATAKNWSDVTIWTSRVPLPQDDVLLSGVSATFTLDMPRLGKNIDWTGATGAPLWNGNLAWSLFGSLTIVAGVGNNIGGGSVNFRGRGSHTIRSSGFSFQAAQIAIWAEGGTYTLSDALLATGFFTLNNGSFVSAGFSVTVREVVIAALAGVSLIMGASVWTLTMTSQTAAVWNMNAVATLSAASSTIVVAGAHTGSRNFLGAGTYGTITYTVANSPGALVFTGANTITTLNIGSGRQVTFPSSTTTIVANWNVAGVANGYVLIPTGSIVDGATVPDSTALSITGDIDIRWRCAFDALAVGPVISKMDSGSSESYRVGLSSNSSGNLNIRVSSNGSAATLAQSSAHGVSLGTVSWFRVTWRASDGRVQFFKASGAIVNPVAADFTQIGADQTAAVGALFDSPAPVYIGGNATLGALGANLSMYRAQIRNGLDGTLVFDADFTTKKVGVDTFTESSAQAATVTINGAGALVGDGRVAIVSSSAGSVATISKPSGTVTSDYLTIKDNTATGGATWIAGGHSWSVSNNSGWNFPVSPSATGGNWSATATWYRGVVPTASSNVWMGAPDGPVTIDTASVCRSLDCLGYVSTLTHASAVGLTIGDATAGLNNVAMRLASGMTYTPVGTTSSITFVSTSTTQQTITFAGKTTGPSMTFSGAGGSWLFADAASVGTAGGGGNVTLTSGTLNTGSQVCSWAGFSTTGSLARTLTMGSSAIAILSTNGWAVASVTNLTFTANTAVVTVSATSATASIVTGFNTNGMSVVFSGSGVQNWSGSGVTVANLTRTGTAAKTDSFSLNGGPIVTGTVSLNGNSATNRILVFGSVLGTATTITAAAVSASNVDFMDITGAGAGSWNLSAISGGSGNCLGNSGISFTAPAPQTWVGTAGGNWSDVSKWTSRVPLPQDDVVIASLFSASQAVTADMPRLGKSIDWTGSTGTPTWALGGTVVNALFGSLTLIAGMTLTQSLILTLSGRGSHTITSAGKAFPFSVSVQGPSGTYTLSDAFITLQSLNVNNGTFVANNFAVTMLNFNSIGGLTRGVTMGSGTWTLSGSGAWTVAAAGLTFSGASATIVQAGSSATSRTFAGAGLTYGTITYTVADSPGALVFTGANTIGTLNVGSGRQVTFPSGSTTTVTNWNVSGAVNGYVYVPALAGNYASTPDSVALSVTGDMDLRVRWASPVWNSGAQQTMLAKFGANGWAFQLGTSANNRLLKLIYYDSGTLGRNANASVVHPFADNAIGWVRMTLDVDNGAGGHDIRFYTSSDVTNNPNAVTWTQLGTTVTTAGVISQLDTSTALNVGSFNNGTGTADGRVYRAAMYGVIGGSTPLFDADFTTKAVGADTFNESSSNAATVTINGTTAQAGDGRVAITSSSAGSPATLSDASGINSSDYLTLKDSTATGGAGWYAGQHSVNVSGNTGWFFTGPPQTVVPNGIPSAAAFGLPVINLGLAPIRPNGIGSAEAMGLPTVTGLNTIALVGIASAEALGVPSLSSLATVRPIGIASAEAIGLPTLTAIARIFPNGIPSAESVGTPAVASFSSIRPLGIPTAEAVGLPSLSSLAYILPTGIPSAESFGVPTLTNLNRILVDGIPTAEAVGVPSLSAYAYIRPIGIASGEGFGLPALRGFNLIQLNGIATAEAVGLLRLLRTRNVLIVQRIFFSDILQTISVPELLQSITVSESVTTEVTA